MNFSFSPIQAALLPFGIKGSGWGNLKVGYASITELLKREVKLVRQAGKQPFELEVCSFVIGIISRLIAYLMIIFILVQGFLYAGKWRPYLNPIYKMEEQYPTGQPSTSHPYEIIQITGTVSPDESVTLLKNGIPLGKIEEGKGILVRLYEGDVLEIDARAVDRPGRIEISSLYGERDSVTWNRRIVIGKKLYRFQPFSFKSPCT